MTVHGAKGLEAPIVILADTTTPPQVRRSASRGCSRSSRARPIAWSGSAPRRPTWRRSQPRERARSEAEHEYRRLLYVAMTRAIGKLVVCGYDGERKRPEGCWYDLVFGALKRHLRGSRPTTATARCGAIARRPSTRRIGRPHHRREGRRATELVQRRWPSSCRRSCRYRRRPPTTTRRWCAARGSRADRKKALARGTLIHRLLQSLPDIPRKSAGRSRAALSRPRCRHFTAEERENDRAGLAGARRCAVRRPVPAGQPCRGADRRAPCVQVVPSRSRGRSIDWW